MGDEFDPYYRWLSIPPEEQPPNHYRLLGLKLLEANADVIESAADRQMTHVRSFQGGKYAEASQQLLNEIASAKLTLLDPAKKSTYDAPLRAKLKTEKPRPSAAAPAARAAKPPATTAPAAKSQPIIAKPHNASKAQSRRQQSGIPPAVIAALACVALLFVVAAGGLVMLLSAHDGTPAVAVNEETSPPPNDFGVAAGETNLPPVPAPTTTDDSPSGPSDLDTLAPVDPPVEIDEPPADDNDPQPAPQVDEPDAETPRPEPPAKLPVPAKAEREAKQASVEAIFNTAAAKSPADKAEVAAQLFRTAGETPDDAVARFVMLNLVRDLAADAAQMQLAFDAIALLEEQFDFDADAIRIATIAQGAKASVPQQAKREVVSVGVELAEKLAAADRYDDAGKLLAGLLDLARRAKDAQVVAALSEKRRANDAQLAAYQDVQDTLAQLKTSPDDPAANLAAGRYYLFIKNDARHGLAHLAKAEGDSLAAVATLELAAPQSPAEQEQLAEAWWKIAQENSDKQQQPKMLARAMAWYRVAQPELTGLAAAAAQRRLQELADAGVQPADLQQDLGEFDDAAASELVTSNLPANLLDMVDANYHSARRLWRRSGDEILSPDEGPAVLRIPVAIRGSYVLRAELTRQAGNDCIGFALPIGASRCGFLLSAYEGRAGGFTMIDGRQLDDPKNPTRFSPCALTNGRRYLVEIEVRLKEEKVSIVAKVDRSVVCRWAGSISSLGEVEMRQLSAQQLGLYTSRARTMFHRVNLVMLDGEAQPTQDARPFEPQGPRIKPPTTTPPTGDGSQGLVAHWQFDEGEGAVARDGIGGRHGEVQGAAWVEGKRGGALHFDGSDDRVRIGNPEELNFAGEISLAAWVKPESIPAASSETGIGNILAHGFNPEPSGEVCLRIRAYEGNQIDFDVASWTGESAGAAAAATPFGEWAHVVGLYDGEVWRLYVNGALASASEPTTQGALPVASDWAIGAHPDQAGRQFHGDIDDVRIYSRALAAKEIETLFAGGEP